MKKLFLLVAAVMLTACASVESGTRVIRYPEAVDMMVCPALEKPADGTIAALYRYGVDAAHRYNNCAAHHSNLIEWVKRGQSAEAAK